MMIEQADETWLSEFKSKIKTDWDFTAIHVNKNNLEGVIKVIVSPFRFFSLIVSNKNPGPLFVLRKTDMGNRIFLRQRYT